MSARVGVFGATGYTGRELVRLLRRHPRARVAFTTGSDTGHLAHEAGLDQAADAYFLALPHGIAATYASRLREARPEAVVIDLSGDLRLPTAESYQQWYGHEHEAPHLIGQAVFGLCEAYRDRLRGARLVSNPGCYATSVLLPLIPLLREGLVDPADIVADAKSGATGAGRTPREDLLFCELAEDFSAYAPGRTHRHVGEIEAVLADRTGQRVELTFCPHLLPVKRGILTALYVKPKADAAELRRALRAAYDGAAFVHVDGRRAAAPLRRGGDERLPHLGARGRARTGGRLLGSRQPREGRGGPGHPEPEPGDGLAGGGRPRLGLRLPGSGLVSVRVYKVGGPALEDPGLVGPLADEVRRGDGPAVLVHGGGRAVDRLLKALRIESRFVDGRRETSPEAMSVVEMVLSGAVNKELAAGLTAAGVPAIGLSGRDGGLVRAKLAPDLGRVGTPERVDPAPLRALWAAGFLPVVSPVANGPLGEAVNVNADEAALGIARAVGATTLVYLSDVDGVRIGGQTAETLTPEETRRWIEDGTIAGGMALKVRVALEASAAGIPEVVIAGKARLLGQFPGTRIMAAVPASEVTR